MDTVCFGPKLYEQIPIPARGEVLYECDIDVRKPGPFECPLDVHFEDGGIRTVTLTVRGVGK
jgi:hypothetical protein